MSCDVFIMPQAFWESWFWDFTRETAAQIQPAGWRGWRALLCPGGHSSLAVLPPPLLSPSCPDSFSRNCPPAILSLLAQSPSPDLIAFLLDSWDHPLVHLSPSPQFC